MLLRAQALLLDAFDYAMLTLLSPFFATPPCQHICRYAMIFRLRRTMLRRCHVVTIDAAAAFILRVFH